MKKFFFTIVILINLISCKSTQEVDLYDKKIASSNLFEVFSKENYDLLRYIDQMHVTADKDEYIPQNYEIRIPKGWKRINITSNRVYLNYGKKQVIVIDGGYINTKKSINSWKEMDIDFPEKSSLLHSYFNDLGYDPKLISREKKNTKTKILTDNRIKVLLFNIKNKDFKAFVGVLNEGVKYIN